MAGGVVNNCLLYFWFKLLSTPLSVIQTCSIAEIKDAKQLQAGWFVVRHDCPGRGVTPLYAQYGDVPLDRVWIFAPLP